MTPKLTNAQAAALRWLRRRGDGGIIDRYGRMVAGGEPYPRGTSIAWLALVAKGLLVGDGHGRLVLSVAGRAAADAVTTVHHSDPDDETHDAVALRCARYR